MKKIIAILIFFIILLPLPCHAMTVYEDNDSHINYQIDDNYWTEDNEITQGIITLKRWRGDCGFLGLMKSDIYEEWVKKDPKTVVSREYLNYKNYFKTYTDGFITGLNENEYYDVDDWTYYDTNKMKFAKFKGKYKDYGLIYDMEGYMTYNNGYAIVFMQVSNNSTVCSDSLESIVKSSFPKTEPKKLEKSNDFESHLSKFLGTAILAAVCFIFAYFKSKNNTEKSKTTDELKTAENKKTKTSQKEEIESPEPEEKIKEEKIVDTEEIDKSIYDEAIDLYKSKEYKKATDNLKQYIDKVTKENKGKYTTCNNQLEFYIYCSLLKPEGNITDLKYNLNNSYLVLGMIEYEQKNYEEAISYLNKGLKYNPVDVKIMFEKAENYKAKNDMKKFLENTKALYKYIYKKSDFARYYRNLGYYYIEQKDWDSAKAVYLYSLRFDNNPVVNNELEFIISRSDDTLPAKNRLESILTKKKIPLFIDESIIDIINDLDKICKSSEEENNLSDYIDQIKDELQI